eukprot:355232-Chlamydomonas_euryale.AAC.7
MGEARCGDDADARHNTYSSQLPVTTGALMVAVVAKEAAACTERATLAGAGIRTSCDRTSARPRQARVH